MCNNRPPRGEGFRRSRIAPAEEDLEFVGQEGRRALLALGPMTKPAIGGKPLVTQPESGAIVGQQSNRAARPASKNEDAARERISLQPHLAFSDDDPNAEVAEVEGHDG